jgi:hypothetical protein
MSEKSVLSMFMGDYALLQGGLAKGEVMRQPARQEAWEAMAQLEAMACGGAGRWEAAA